MILGIEIGGTKLQLGVGAGGGRLEALERLEVDPARGATGILEQIESTAAALLQKHSVERVGVGFGGPVQPDKGRVYKSHQIDGWEDFPLRDWCQQHLKRPTRVANDCDVAALAEASVGAGQGAASVFYVTVGTGVGGGFVVDGRPFGANRPAVAEIGHLRPGLHADRPEDTVESLASGWGIAAAAVARITGQVSRPFEVVRRHAGRGTRQMVRKRIADSEQADQEYAADLLERCQRDPERLTAQIVAQAAGEGNEIAREILQHAYEALGWAIAQTITLLAPEVVVLGGGVSLIGPPMFASVRHQIQRYIFPPLAGSCRLVPAGLGELAVVHGAIELGSRRL